MILFNLSNRDYVFTINSFKFVCDGEFLYISDYNKQEIIDINKFLTGKMDGYLAFNLQKNINKLVAEEYSCFSILEIDIGKEIRKIEAIKNKKN